MWIMASVPARLCCLTCWETKRQRSFLPRCRQAAYSERERGHTGNFFQCPLGHYPALLAVVPKHRRLLERAIMVLRSGSKLGQSIPLSRITGRRGRLVATRVGIVRGRLLAGVCTATEKSAGHWQEAVLHSPAIYQQVEAVIQSGRGFAYKTRRILRTAQHERTAPGLINWSPAVRLRSLMNLAVDRKRTLRMSFLVDQ